jgi:hypothetical protein
MDGIDVTYALIRLKTAHIRRYWTLYTPSRLGCCQIEDIRRNEDRIISERLFTSEDIDEMDNRLEDVEEEDIIEDVD